MTLQKRELSAEEAFLVATRRLGQPAEIAREFGKADPGMAWGMRASWMLAGMLFWMFSADVIRLVKSTAVYVGGGLTQNGLKLGWLSVVTHTLVFADILVIFWLLARGRLTGSIFVGKQLQQHPVWWVGGLIIGLLVLQVSSGLVLALTFKQFGPEMLGQRYMVERWFSIGIGLLQTSTIVGGMVWLRRRQSKQVSISAYGQEA